MGAFLDLKLNSMVDLSNTVVELPVTMVDLPDTVVKLPDAKVDLPDTVVNLPYTMGHLPDTMVDLPKGPKGAWSKALVVGRLF